MGLLVKRKYKDRIQKYVVKIVILNIIYFLLNKYLIIFILCSCLMYSLTLMYPYCNAVYY
jgi:hypothetical protein